MPGLLPTPRRGAAASRPGADARGTRSRSKAGLVAGEQEPRRGARVARGHDARARTISPSWRSVGPTFEDARRAVARRRRARPHRPAPRQAARRTRTRRSTACAARWSYQLLPEFGPRIAEEITEIDWQRVDRRARPLGPVPLDHREAHLGRVGHLRLGVGAVASPRPAQPAAPGRAARRTTRSRACASRLAPEAAALLAALEPGGPSPLRDRLLRGPAPLGDLPPRMGRRPRGRRASRRGCSSAAPRARPAPSDARRSPTTSAPSSPTPGSARAARATGKVVDRSVMSGKIAARVDSRAGTPPA